MNFYTCLRIFLIVSLSSSNIWMWTTTAVLVLHKWLLNKQIHKQAGKQTNENQCPAFCFKLILKRVWSLKKKETLSRFLFPMHRDILLETYCSRKCSLFSKSQNIASHRYKTKFALTSDNDLLAKLCLLLVVVFANHSPQKEQCALYPDSDQILWIKNAIVSLLCSVSCL